MKQQISYFFIFIQFIAISAVPISYCYNIAGFISQGFNWTSDNNFYTDTNKGSFQFNELGININTRISPKITAGVQLISYTIGELGKNELAIDWGYADLRVNKYLGIKSGIIKGPLGFYNETRDIDAALLFIYLPSSVYAIQDRDTILRLSGVSIYGEISTGILGDLNYQILAGRPDMDETKGSARAFEDVNPSFWDITEVKMNTNYIFNIKWHTPFEGLILGGTYRTSSLKMTMYMSDFNKTLEIDIPKGDMWTFGTKYEWKNVILDYEFYNRVVKFTIPGAANASEPTSRGWYTSIKFIFTDHIQAGMYYSEYYDDIDDRSGKKSNLYEPDAKAWQEEICLSVRFDITDTWIFKVEHHWMNGAAILFRSDHMDTNGNISMKENWQLFATKLSYTF